MSNFDLEKYRNAWKNELSFNERKLTENEISNFMQSSSKSIVVLFKKGLVFDISFKIALLISLIFLFFLLQGQSAWRFIVAFQGLIILAGIFWQWKILHKIPSQTDKALNALDKLRKYIDFYYKYYISTIYIGALSVTFFFLIGSTYYLHIKYLEIPPFQTDDIIVWGIGLVLSFGFGAIVQLKQYNFHIKQLEESLKEIVENTISEQHIKENKNRNIRNQLLIGILLIIGLVLLILLILKFIE